MIRRLKTNIKNILSYEQKSIITYFSFCIPMFFQFIRTKPQGKSADEIQF